ncbi:hypothetical protein D3C77_490350 [compost metagenome]
MVQEGRGAHVQHDHLAVAGNAQVVDVLDRRLGLALAGAEGTEVMGTEQALCGFGHALDIQRPVVPGNFLGQMRRADRVVVDHVAVTPGAGLEAGMEVCRHRPRPDHTDVVGQVEVGAHGPGALVAHGAGVEVHDLPAAVYAGVGAPGADHRNRLVGHRGQRLLQGLLDTGHAAGLALPATVARAFVFHAQGDAGVAFGRGFGGSGVDDVQEHETCGVYGMAGIITTTAAV